MQDQRSLVDNDRRALLTAGLVGAVVAATALMSGAAQAQGTPAPIGTDKPFWPHPKWGKDDVAGASNYITPAKVLDTVKLIKDGKVYRIGRVYESAMPKFGDRSFALRIPGSPTGGPFGNNKMIYHDEFLATEIGQSGTQFDGLGHIGIQMGEGDGDKNEMRASTTATTSQEIGDAYRPARSSASRTASRCFTRGHLIDVEGAEGGKPWDVGQEIMVADVKAAAWQKQGDAGGRHQGRRRRVLQHRFPGASCAEQATTTSSNSGRTRHRPRGRQVADRQEYLRDRRRHLGDRGRAQPEQGPRLRGPLQEPIPKNGIYNHENLDFTALIADKKYQFVYIFAGADQRRDRLEQRH